MTIIKAFTNVFFTRTEGKYYFCESFALCVSVFNLVYLSFFLFFINVNEDAVKKKTKNSENNKPIFCASKTSTQ